MTRQTEACTDLVGECVVFLFRNFCIGQDGITEDPTTWPSLSGSLTMKGITAPPTDPNGAIYLLEQGSKVHNFSFKPGETQPGTEFGWEVCAVDGCEYLAVKTCSLVANIDSEGLGRALSPEGTRYCANLKIGGSSLSIKTEFEIDAGIDYSAEYECECIPIGVVAVDGDIQVAAGSDVFSLRVCATDCLIDLTARVAANEADIADHEARIVALEAEEHTTLDSVTATDNGDGTTSITVTLSDGSTDSAAVPTPEEVFVTGVDYGASPVDNGDGTSTVTITVTLSDGTTIPASYIIPNPIPDTDTDTWITPTSLSIDPTSGEISFGYLDQNGDPQTLTDLVAPFADTNTTNATFVWDQATGALTITDSAGDSLAVTIAQADVADNGNGTATFTDAAGDACTVPTSVPVKCNDDDYAKGETYKPLTQEQGHAPSIVTGNPVIPVDPACVPALPGCPIDGMVTFGDEGITWQIQGGVWVPVAFTPKETRRVMNDDPGGTTVIDNAALSAAGAGWIEGDCIEEEYTNTDCVPVVIEADIRMIAQLAAGGGNFWSARLTPDAGGTNGFVNSMGSPDSIMDTRGVSTNFQVKDLLWNKWFTNPIAPGDSVTLRACAQYRVDVYNAAVGFTQAISLVGLTGRLQVRRSL